MDSSTSFHPYLDELIAFASAEPRKPDLLVAKAEYFQLNGEIFEDDKSFELRMASFLDYYLFDRVSPLSGKTPAAEMLEQRAGDPPEVATVFRGFTETHHGLFEVRRISPGLIRLRDLNTEKDFDVTERRVVAGLEKGDLIEARLIPFAGQLLFSQAFIYQPREAFKLIRAEIKRRKKKEPERPFSDMLHECARRALKADRYRQIAVEKIYDFEGKPVV
ncbi:MAG: hypothetical protein ACKVPX_00950 [Myxococcaceae bacterium]